MGDYTRFTHKPEKRYTGVLMQQGRVQLDADWNEQIEILQRRWELQALDTFSTRDINAQLQYCAVPKWTTPDAFKIDVIPGPTPDLTLGVGRIYVDGLLAEILDGESFSYLHQPFYPDPPTLPEIAKAGIAMKPPHHQGVAYLDVWQREVTSIEDSDLLDKALGGSDTTTRLQTVWQVKVANTFDARCIVLDLEALPRSGGRLSTRAVVSPASDDPCIIGPSGGYRGLENRLYRVEVHTGGDLASARFKWSQDNASVVSAIKKITTNGNISELTVTRIGRDQILRFHVGDWVEILDDHRELMGEPGEMARVAFIEEGNQVVRLDRSIPSAGSRAFGANGKELAQRHTRLRRWDQQEYLVGDTGLMAMEVDWFPLKDGVQVRFALPTGEFRVGDYWVFAARTADNSVEELVEAPPRGIIHHYCKLAAISDLATEKSDVRDGDCRPLWPEDEGTGGPGLPGPQGNPGPAGPAGPAGPPGLGLNEVFINPDMMTAGHGEPGWKFLNEDYPAWSLEAGNSVVFSWGCPDAIRREPAKLSLYLYWSMAVSATPVWRVQWRGVSAFDSLKTNLINKIAEAPPDAPAAAKPHVLQITGPFTLDPDPKGLGTEDLGDYLVVRIHVAAVDPTGLPAVPTQFPVYLLLAKLEWKLP